METTNAFSRVYATTYNAFTVCMVCYIVIGTYCIVRWAKTRFKQVYGDIRDQLDEFIDKYYDVLNKYENDNANLRDYVADIETRVIYLQSIVPGEVTMRRINDDATANYANLGERINSLRSQTLRDIQGLEENYSVIKRYVQMDDKHKQVLIGYVNHNFNERYMGVPVFCPKNTTDLDKYLGNFAVLVLDSLAQLPNYKELNFTKYYYSNRRSVQYHPVGRFIDTEGNVIADMCGRTLDESATLPWIKDHYANEFQKVQDYCKKIGVNCI
jgi:hypothetical protein